MIIVKQKSKQNRKHKEIKMIEKLEGRVIGKEVGNIRSSTTKKNGVEKKQGKIRKDELSAGGRRGRHDFVMD